MRVAGGPSPATLATYSNLDRGTTYVQRTVDLSAYAGQTVRLRFTASENAEKQTSFVIDDVAVTAAS